MIGFNLIKGEKIGIYKITSPSGRVYIGQSWHIRNRLRFHVYPEKSKAGNSILEKSFKKYGYDSHKCEIIHELPKDVSQDVLNLYEELYIELYKSCGVKMSNVRNGGLNAKQTPEHIERMRQKMKGNTWGFKKGMIVWNKGTKGICKAWNKGTKGKIVISDETKKKLSIANKGKQNSLGVKMPEKTREALKKANTGRKMPKHLNELLSKYRTPDNARAMGYKNRGKIRTEENKLKISQTLKNRQDNKGELHNMAKLTNIIVLEIRDKYKPKRVYSTSKLAKEYGISNTNVKDIINRKIWKHI